MMQYANSFSCAISGQKDEVIICFEQNQPIVDEDGNITGVNKDSLTSIVMTMESARHLMSIIESLLVPLDDQTGE